MRFQYICNYYQQYKCMTKEDFIKMFPDVKVQQFETDTILSK